MRLELSAADPDNVDLHNDLAASHVRIGDILKNTGDVSGALSEYEKALVIREALPETGDYQRLLAFTLNCAGDMLVKMSALAKAREFFDRSLVISKKLAAENMADDRLQRDLSVAYGRVASVFGETGDHNARLHGYREQLHIREKLLARNPTSRYRRDVAVAHLFIGLAFLDLEQPGDALSHLIHFRDVSQQRAEANPKNWRTKRDLGAGCEFVGRAQMRMGDLVAATTSFDRCQSIIMALSEQNPDNTELKEFVASCYAARGLLAMTRDDTTAAVEYFSDAVRGFDLLAAGYSENFDLRAKHAEMILGLGTALAAAGRIEDAVDRLETARELFESLFAAQQEKASVRLGLAETLCELATLEAQRGSGREAQRHARHALDVLDGRPGTKAVRIRTEVQSTLSGLTGDG
jgi:tetratricopeptide (TPR) repeat protein